MAKMRISVYRQLLRDAFYERLSNSNHDSLFTVEYIKRIFEEAGEEVIWRMIDEVETKESR